MALSRVPKQRRTVSPNPDVVPSPPPIDTPGQAQSKLPLSEVKQKGGSHDGAPPYHGDTEQMPLSPHDRSSQLQKTNKRMESKQNSNHRGHGSRIQLICGDSNKALVWTRGKLLQLRCPSSLTATTGESH